MKLILWLVSGLIICMAIGAIFLYWYRIELEVRVDKEIQIEVDPYTFNHELYDRVLQKYVDSEGFVDYDGLKANPQELEAYLDLLAVVDPEDLPYEAKLPFWINTYNALTIKGVLDHYPTRSVRKIKPLGGFFRRIKFKVGGHIYTLNDIEHGIIRGEFGEPRIHFALVCASVGCPTLENRAFVRETLEERLEDATYNFIKNKTKNRLDKTARVLYLSKIFQWYAQDFEDTHDGVIDFIADYLPKEDAQFIKGEDITIKYLDYDWTLTDQALHK